MDFELASMNAVREVLLGSNIVGCLFHWAQAVWRKVAGLGLRNRCDLEVDVKKSVYMLLALPFLPTNDVKQVFLNLRESRCFVCASRCFACVGVHRPDLDHSLFPPHSWNVYQACLDKLERTNNYVEAWHSKFAKLLHSSHSNIWKFLQNIRNEQRDNNQQFIQLLAGQRNSRHPTSKI